MIVPRMVTVRVWRKNALIRFRTVCPSASRLIAAVNACAGAAEEGSDSLFRPNRRHSHSFMASGGRCEGPGGMVKS